MQPTRRWAALAFLILGLVLRATPSSAQALDMRRELAEKFETELGRIGDSFEGIIGAQFVDLTDGEKISLNAVNVFPTASAIKVAVLVELFHQEDQKPGLLKQQRPFAPKDQTAQGGMARLIGPTSSLSLEDIAKLMINLSENAAANILIDEVGMESVNRLTRSLGLTTMKLQRKMLQRELQARGEDNLSSPADAATLMTRIARCQLPVSKASCDRIRQILEIRQPPHPGKDPIPNDIPVAFKWGGNEGVSTAWAIVNLPDRPYVFAIMTTYGTDNATAVRAASAAAFGYYSRLARSNVFGGRVSKDVMRKERAR